MVDDEDDNKSAREERARRLRAQIESVKKRKLPKQPPKNPRDFIRDKMLEPGEMDDCVTKDDRGGGEGSEKP